MFKKKIKIRLFLFILFPVCLSAQVDPFGPPEIADPFERAISEFYKPFEQQDFTEPIRLLEELKSKNPNSAEIHYFLGYAYDRFNSLDARSIPSLEQKISLKASEEFESVIQIDSIYQGRKIALDPYSKITAIWGSLALKYFHAGVLDSMNYAFMEGKKRGGYHDILLEIGRNILSTCDENSLLFVSGDNFYFPILYVQSIENFRTDVQAISISMLSTNWYCELIQNTSNIDFLKSAINYNDIPPYVEATKQTVIVQNQKNCPEFKWEIDQLRNGKYLIKGDSILKEIITQNKFERGIYFTIGQYKEDLLSLDKYFLLGALTDKVNNCGIPQGDFKTKQLKNASFKAIKSTPKIYSPDILNTLDNYRITYANLIQEEVSKGNFDKAKELLNEMDGNLPTHVAPMNNEALENYFSGLKRSINN